MTHAIRSEVLKLTTVRGTYILVAITATLAAVAGTIFTAPIAENTWIEMPVHPFLPMYVTIVGLFAYALGARAITDEYRYGTLTATALATPKRARIIAAKAIVNAGAGAFTSLMAVAVTSAVVMTWQRSHPSAMDLTWGELIPFAAAVVGAGALFASIGVGVGAIVSHPVGAMVGGLGWFAVAEPAMGAVVGDALRYMPGHAAASFAGAHVEGMLSQASGGAVFALLAIAALAAGAVTVTRRDIG